MSSPSDTPPPYPGPSPFSLLSYDDTTAVDDSADSLRLPSYQPRTSRRYHPYSRVKNNPRHVFSRYENTIYDDFYIPLDVSPATSHLPVASATVNNSMTVMIPTPTIPAPIPILPPSIPAHNNELGTEEQHRRRVLRLFHLIPEFERAVRQGLVAAQHQKCCADTEISTDKDNSTTN